MCNAAKKLERGIRKAGRKIEDVAKFEIGHARDIFRDIRQDPTRLLTGVDPLSTSLWNGILGTDNEPLVNMFGGATEKRFADAEARGLDTSWARGLHDVASTIAGFYGGRGLMDVFNGSELGSMFGNWGGESAGTLSPAQGGFGMGPQSTGGASSGIGSMFGMSGNQVGGTMDLLRGGFGLYQANQLKKASQPSAINRQAEAELAALMADPSRVASLPGYEAGLEAVQRGMAAQGYLGSGNMATALLKYGGDFYNNALTQYGNLSQLGRGNSAAYRMGGIELAGQALNSLGYGGLKLFGK
jgi:hypothetical protein